MYQILFYYSRQLNELSGLLQEAKRAEAEEQRIVEEAKKVAELRKELDAHAEIDLAKVKYMQ